MTLWLYGTDGDIVTGEVIGRHWQCYVHTRWVDGEFLLGWRVRTPAKWRKPGPSFDPVRYQRDRLLENDEDDDTDWGSEYDPNEGFDYGSSDGRIDCDDGNGGCYG